MLLTAALLIAAGSWKGEVSTWSPEIVITLVLWSSASALAYVAWDFGMRKGNMVLVSTASMLIPLLSTVITCFVNHIPLTGGLLFASACIVAGAALCRRGIYD